MDGRSLTSHPKSPGLLVWLCPQTRGAPLTSPIKTETGQSLAAKMHRKEKAPFLYCNYALFSLPIAYMTQPPSPPHSLPFTTLHPNLLIGIHQAFEYMKGKGVTEGAVYEFGVFRGFSFWFANQLAAQFHFDFESYGFDSFEGLPPSNVDFHRNWKPGSYACTKEAVEENLHKWGMPLPYVLHKGYFSEALFDAFEASHPAKTCRLAIIDSDLYESAVEVLHYLAKKIQTEPIIVLFDDFNAFGGDPNHGERKALAEFTSTQAQFSFSPLFSFGQYGQAFQMNKGLVSA